jgi:AcrR family transcriptional regulator
MAGPPPKPLQLTRVQRRTMLGQHFAEVLEPVLQSGESFADLSVERIITAGGIARSTFYAYFEDKGDLLRAMAERVIGELFEAGTSWWELTATGSQTTEGVRAALGPAVETYRAHRAILGAVLEGASYDVRVREQHQRLIREATSSLAAHVQESQRRGSTPSSLDAPRTAAWLIWMIERGLYQLVSPAPDVEAQALLDALAEMVWRTLYAREG